MEQEKFNSCENEVSDLLSRLQVNNNSLEVSSTGESLKNELNPEQVKVLEKKHENKRMEMLSELFDEIAKFV